MGINIMENPLSKLVIDYWYKALMAVGVVVFLASGAGLLPKYPSEIVGPISFGIFFWGLGEWINHPYQEAVEFDPFGNLRAKISGYPRNPKPVGVLFDLIGIATILYGIFQAFFKP